MDKKNKYTVFVVEDSDVYRSILVQALESENENAEARFSYNVHGFGSGEECIANMHLKPDIMIMDYLLDGNGYVYNMDGFRLLKQIKSIAPRLDIIVLSCQNSAKVVKALMREGIREYIKKEGLGQHRIKQLVHDFIQRRENKTHRMYYALAGVIFLVVTLSVLAFLSM